MTEIYNATNERKEQARRLLKDFLKENDVSVYKLAKLLNIAYGRSASVSNLMNKLSRSSFKVTELLDIVDVLGYELQIVPKTSIEGSKKTTSKS